MKKKFELNQAISEANRCLLCYDAPCSAGCPAGTDPGLFIRKLRLRNITGAIRTIKKNNILGGVCGALCPASELCEKKCCATGIDRAIAIGKIQQALIEYSYKINFEVFEKPEQREQKEKKMHKIAVIGSGPAGLSCAATLAQKGFKVTIFEKMPNPGGVLRYGVPSHRLPDDLLEEEINDILKLGVEIKCSSPVNNDIPPHAKACGILADNYKKGAEEFLAKGYSAVFIATGLWQPVSLKEGSSGAKGIFSSIDFLRSIKENKVKEILNLIKDKTIAVIGGGSAAIDCAESAMKLGAKDVYIIYRRSFNEMPATVEEKISALKAGIHYIILSKPIDYVFSPGGSLKHIKLARTKLGSVDSSGRRKPVDVLDSEWLFEADAVIEAIGQTENNFIITNNKTGETSVKNIFAGGDIVRGPALVVEAVNDGKVAAKEIMARL